MNKLKLVLICFAILSILSCTTNKANQSAIPKTGMLKVTILYPNGEGKSFDMDYYETKHMPMMAGLIGKNLHFYEIDKGISGRTPSDKVPFLAIGYFYIRDLAEYNRTISQNITAIRQDIEKYTNIQPIIQISEIRQVKQ